MSAWTRIQHIEVPSGGQATIEFTNIAQTYTDLVVVGSVRGDGTSGLGNFTWNMSINGVTTNRIWRLLYGSSGNGSINGTGGVMAALPDANSTSNNFASFQIYLPNYSGNTNKSISLENVAASNSATIWENDLFGGLWSSTAAITSLSLSLSNATNFVQYSSATLYGITKGSSGGVTVS
jgi:hypothetical protein